MAKPIDDSAAATVRTKIAKIWPKISSTKYEKIKKLKFAANNINSTQIIISIMFFLLVKTPIRPIKNNKNGMVKIITKFIKILCRKWLILLVILFSSELDDILIICCLFRKFQLLYHFFWQRLLNSASAPYHDQV